MNILFQLNFNAHTKNDLKDFKQTCSRMRFILMGKS